MIARTHLAIGATYALSALPALEAGIFTPLQFGLLFAGILIGSLLPDIDHPQSLISRKLLPLGWITQRLTTHRGFTHSILGAFVLFILLTFTFGFIKEAVGSDDPFFMASGILIGFALHLLADFSTYAGIRLAYPLKINFKLMLVRTGGTFETIFRYCLLAVCSYFIIGFIL